MRGLLFCCMTSLPARILGSRYETSLAGVYPAEWDAITVVTAKAVKAAQVNEQFVLLHDFGDPHTPVDLQEQARLYCDSLRTNPDIWQLCMQRFGSSGYAEVQFWCLQTLQQVR